MEGSSDAEIGLTSVSTLAFKNLPSFVSFISGKHAANWPSLEDVTVNNCPNIKNYGLGLVDRSQLMSVKVQLHSQENTEMVVGRLFYLLDKLSDIKEFDIDGDEELSKILAVDHPPSHFSHVVRLLAKNCDERLNDFLSRSFKSLGKLEDLTIKECKIVKHVFHLDERDGKGDGKYCAKLKAMRLCNLPHLTCIWNKDSTGLFGLGCLENIHIEKCGLLPNLIPVTTAERLKKLHQLRVHSCQKIEELVARDTVMDTRGPETSKKVIKFQSLEKLELKDLFNLIKFHRGSCAIEFPSLNFLKIENCPQMMSFTTGFASAEELYETEGTSFTELRELELDTCDQLIYVIHSIMLPRFQNLEKLTVNRCKSLTDLIQFHREFNAIGPMLPMLSKLILIDLPNLRIVISIGFASTKFFQNLQILRVKGCNSLVYLYLPLVPNSSKLRELQISDCKALKEIFVTKGEEMSENMEFTHLSSIVLENLPKLSCFSFCTFPSLDRLDITNCPALRTFASGFPGMEDLPAAFLKNFEPLVNLKKLLINYEVGVENLWHNKHPSEPICDLEVLTLKNSNNLFNVIPSSMLKRFNKLKNFTVEGCKHLTEVFDHDGATEILPELTEFALICLPSLTHLWSKEPQVSVFKCLASLQIIECHGLKNLFSLSTAKHLQQLKLLKLYGCKNMEEVFVKEKETIPEIVFCEVECLILKQLPNLVSFCRQSTTFKWPKLRIVRVSEIPKLKTFSKGCQETPDLKAVYVTFLHKCWREDLNGTIQYLHNESQMRKVVGEGRSKESSAETE